MGRGRSNFQVKVGGKEILSASHKRGQRNAELSKLKAEKKAEARKQFHDTVREFIKERGETQRHRSTERSKGTKYRAAGLAAGSVGNNAVDSAYSLTKGGVNDDHNQDQENGSGAPMPSFGGGRSRA